MSEHKEILTVDFTQPVYLPPLGTPLNWYNEKGDLPAAVKRYINHSAQPDRYHAPSAKQLNLVISFLRYFIGAPCWEGPGDSLQRLCEQAERMATVAEVQAWIHECLKINLDPL